MFQDLPAELKSLFKAFEAELKSLQQTGDVALTWAKRCFDLSLITTNKLWLSFGDYPQASKQSNVFLFKLIELLIVHMEQRILIAV